MILLNDGPDEAFEALINVFFFLGEIVDLERIVRPTHIQHVSAVLGLRNTVEAAILHSILPQQSFSIVEAHPIMRRNVQFAGKPTAAYHIGVLTGPDPVHLWHGRIEIHHRLPDNSKQLTITHKVFGGLPTI